MAAIFCTIGPVNGVELAATFSTAFPFVSIPQMYCALEGYPINFTCSFLIASEEKLTEIEWRVNDSVVYSWNLNGKSSFAGVWSKDSAAEEYRFFVRSPSGSVWGRASVSLSHVDLNSTVTCSATVSTKLYHAVAKFRKFLRLSHNPYSSFFCLGN